MEQQLEPYQAVIQKLTACRIRYETGLCLARYSYMKTGGTLRVLIIPETMEELCRAIDVCHESGAPFRVLGATTNVLFLDDRNYGIFITTVRLDSIRFEQDGIMAECGALLGDLSRFALRHGITGYEGLEGIPGTVGGAVFMNAGAYGSEIKDVAKRFVLYDVKKGAQEVDAAAMQFGYRSSILQQMKDTYVVRGFFSCAKNNKDEIYDRMGLYHEKRHRYQEFCYPNLGSLFAGNIYSALADEDRTYRLFLALYRRIVQMRRLFARRAPGKNAYLNRITAAHFNLQEFRDTYSRKTMNCLVNTGQGTDKMLAYIRALQRLTRGRLNIENEIMDNGEN